MTVINIIILMGIAAKTYASLVTYYTMLRYSGFAFILVPVYKPSHIWRCVLRFHYSVDLSANDGVYDVRYDEKYDPAM